MKIWCIEDDADIREIELYTLSATGFEVRGFSDAAAFFEALRMETPSLVLLDVMLPGEDGVSVLKKLRSYIGTKDLPVIMATAKGAEYDKIQSLDLGADDYLVKPFGMMEMVSRIKAVLRRCAPASDADTLTLGGLMMNLSEYSVFISGERVDLTFKEFELLKLFMKNPNIVFTREQLFSLIWAEDFVGESRTVDMHIRTLRRKLGEYGEHIETVRGVGYRLEARR